MFDKNIHLKLGQWCWIVCDQSDTEQNRMIGMFLEKDDLGDVWMVTKKGDKFETGQYSIRDLIPLHNCTGWNYRP